MHVTHPGEFIHFPFYVCVPFFKKFKYNYGIKIKFSDRIYTGYSEKKCDIFWRQESTQKYEKCIP